MGILSSVMGRVSLSRKQADKLYEFMTLAPAVIEGLQAEVATLEREIATLMSQNKYAKQARDTVANDMRILVAKYDDLLQISAAKDKTIEELECRVNWLTTELNAARLPKESANVKSAAPIPAKAVYYFKQSDVQDANDGAATWYTECDEAQADLSFSMVAQAHTVRHWIHVLENFPPELFKLNFSSDKMNRRYNNAIQAYRAYKEAGVVDDSQYLPESDC